MSQMGCEPSGRASDCFHYSPSNQNVNQREESSPTVRSLIIGGSSFLLHIKPDLWDQRLDRATTCMQAND